MAEDSAGFPLSILKVLELLSSGGVPYVVVGGMAMVFHGIPRATLDVDILVPAEQDTLRLLLTILEKQRLACSEEGIVLLLDRPDFLVGQWLTFADREGREVLDVMPENPASFQAISVRAVARESGGVLIPVACLEDMRLLKQASGRPVDVADIGLLDERIALDKDRTRDEGT